MKTQTIEQTGKWIKAQQFLALVVILVGILWMLGSLAAGGDFASAAWTFIAGLAWHYLAKALGWWFHG